MFDEALDMFLKKNKFFSVFIVGLSLFCVDYSNLSI